MAILWHGLRTLAKDRVYWNASIRTAISLYHEFLACGLFECFALGLRILGLKLVRSGYKDTFSLRIRVYSCLRPGRQSGPPHLQVG